VIPHVQLARELPRSFACNRTDLKEITMRTLVTAAILAATTLPAAAETAVALSGDRTLVWIDTATATVTGSVEVQGVDRLLGIDLRPADNTVVGVTADHKIVVIDHMTGATTEKATMNVMLPSTDGPVVVDFNPAADRLRFMTGTTNHRVHPDTGEVTVDGSLAFVAEDMHAGEAPNIVAAAYINSYGKPEKTAMFNIDATIAGLIQQTAPNDGTLAAIGKLGVALDGPVGFDVATSADGTNTAWLAANGGLHTVDLETGALTGSWMLTGADQPIRDLTILPAM
jgi:DNA-binding beta-propeller fold protein YncE